MEGQEARLFSCFTKCWVDWTRKNMDRVATEAMLAMLGAGSRAPGNGIGTGSAALEQDLPRSDAYSAVVVSRDSGWLG